MQTILRGRKIEEDDKKQGILEIVSGIPISTIYRRLQTLHDNKLVRISGSINEDGKKYFLYKSKVKAISTNFNGDLIEMEIVPNISGQSLENDVIQYA
jgi:predicted transcriptional regulator